MDAREENRQLNNAGFSLLELLIAVVILAIIVVPIMNSFLVSMKTNAKAERTMDTTAIAENVMEEFEARSIEEMKVIYEKEGYTIEENPETNPDGKWVFVGTDSDVTGRDYQLEVTLDPSAYTVINDVELVDVQNLVGTMNAVFSEKKNAELEAVGYFQNYTDKDDEVAKHINRVVNINIDKNLISVDLGGGETKAVETYLVTAQVYYTCEWTELYSGSPTKYPHSNNEFIIFSNQEAVKDKAAEIKQKKADGTTLTETDVVESRLANVVVCLRPRFAGGKDIITINNKGNVSANLYFVEQDVGTIVNNGYTIDFELVERCESGWNMTGRIDTTKAACQLRTNFPKNDYVTYKYKDANTGDAVSGADAIKVMQTTNLTPTNAYDRMYDIIVKVYEDGTRGSKEPIVTMTGTVTN